VPKPWADFENWVDLEKLGREGEEAENYLNT